MALIVAPTAGAGVSGIYRITNIVTGKVYVGSAVNLRRRFNKHLSDLRNGVHHSEKLQRSWHKHGESAFLFEVLLICAPKDLIYFEQRAIETYQAVLNGYNVLPVAGSAIGAKRTEETRARISASKIGIKRAPFSEEHLARMSAAHTGKQRCLGYKHTEEARANMRAKGFSQEHRAALSSALKGNENARGVVHSADTRRKVSAALKGNKHRLGKTLSDDQKAQISAMFKGKPKSPEQRAKMAESARLAWIERRKQ